MKKQIIIPFVLLTILVSCKENARNNAMKENHNPLTIAGTQTDSADRNNNFYDNTETFALTSGPLEIAGEVENPGKVDFSVLPKRSVIVKETLLDKEGKDAFVGAYRYDGYSLFDILNNFKLKKKNKEEFSPIIDIYVEIENAKGEKVILSWGEIYYPNTLHNIIIATDVARIVPSKTRDLWPLPTEGKLVVGPDLITERNIPAPVKITVHSYERSFKVNRDLSPLYSANVTVYVDSQKETFDEQIMKKYQMETLHTIFYGKGRGIHSTTPFSGIYLKEILKSKLETGGEDLQKGLVAVVGKDGYRCVYSLSEIMNRNDQAEILMVPTGKEEDGGLFRVFPSCDFFSDRAVKAVSEIYCEKIK